ncbi:DUF456 domain-containing protein [Halobium salinum]|uniref:DUF456 domain-containing protein n=1 Tax=Halobium salinum TaxID=1364940 RepID=A0ABD5P8J2_9EURY|nr:DUF456 domain-containing protein [Halobium salinum]
MADLLVLVAFALLVLGVVGSVVPGLPGALASLAGVGLYWYTRGFADPSLPVLVVLLAVGLAAAVVEFAGGAVAARAGGASTRTTVLATLVGLVLALVTGPVGLVAGVAGTVFAVEFARNDDADASARTALYATVGVLASTAVQALLTLSMLGAMVLVYVY